MLLFTVLFTVSIRQETPSFYPHSKTSECAFPFYCPLFSNNSFKIICCLSIKAFAKLSGIFSYRPYQQTHSFD